MNVPFRYWRSILSLALAGVMAGGCVKIDATLRLERNGSGSLRTIYAMPAFLVKQLEVTRQWARSLDLAAGKPTNAAPAQVEIPMIFDEAALKPYFAAMAADGVTLEALKTRDQGGWKYVDFTVKFTRFDGLVKQPCFRDCGVAFKTVGDSSC